MERVKLEEEEGRREVISCETGTRLKCTRWGSRLSRSCATSSENYSTSIEEAMTCKGIKDLLFVIDY